MAEFLSSKNEALKSNLSITKKKGRKVKREGEREG
jgi:hypothetical protein